MQLFDGVISISDVTFLIFSIFAIIAVGLELGTLIGVSGTDDVASAYAATYPIALIAVVLVSQFLIILF